MSCTLQTQFRKAWRRGEAQFGEFDALVGTPKATYLIESKWTGAQIINGHIRLKEWQVLRHRVFRWIRNEWLRERAATGQMTWQQFYAAKVEAFEAEFRPESKMLARPTSRLARNLEFVLQQLAAFPARTMDVLVYFHIEDAPIPNGVAGNPEFVVVPVLYQPLNGTGMIEMEP